MEIRTIKHDRHLTPPYAEWERRSISNLRDLQAELRRRSGSLSLASFLNRTGQAGARVSRMKNGEIYISTELMTIILPKGYGSSDDAWHISREAASEAIGILLRS